VPSRVGVDAPLEATGVQDLRQRRRSQRADLSVRRFQIVHENVQMHLLRHNLPRPLWRPVVTHLLERQPVTVLTGTQRDPPVLAISDLPAKHVRPETCQDLDVRAVQHKVDKASDGGHQARLPSDRRLRPTSTSALTDRFANSHDVGIAPGDNAAIRGLAAWRMSG
jgi:hypothetical protein